MLVADFEVFKYYWLLVAKDPATKEVFIIENDPIKLRRLYEQKKNEIWAFFNDKYDKFIFKGILLGYDPKVINDYIIKEKRAGWSFSKEMFTAFPLETYDIKKTLPSLKVLEAFMGEDIRETTVPFDLDRPLTQEEKEQVIFYCTHDVEQSILVLCHTYSTFKAHVDLCKAFNVPKYQLTKPAPALSTLILGAKKQKPKFDDFNIDIQSTVNVTKHPEVLDWFKQCCNDYKEKGVPKEEIYSRKLSIDICGTPHVFAWGGLHGALPNYHSQGLFVMADVGSYYPSLMVRYNFYSRSITNPEKYKSIYHDRLKYKAEKNPLAAPYKLALNASYGELKNKYSNAYDPRMANNICVNGQLLLLDLIEHIDELGCATLVQSNTDGVLFKIAGAEKEDELKNLERIKDVAHAWEQRSGMKLEFDLYHTVHQRDVNNYVIIGDGGVKSKGGDVKKLSPIDFNLPIVNYAIKEYFYKGIPPRETITKCNKLQWFQIVYKLQGKYIKTLHNGNYGVDKVNRVFASLDEHDTALYKVYTHASGEERKAIFANCPTHCFIDNAKVKNETIPNKLDKQWYIDLANSRINAWF